MKTSKPLRLKISLKLFSAFFLILIIVVGGLLLSRYLHVRNIKAFIREMEADRINRIILLITEAYQAHNSWEGITEDKALLMKLKDQAPKFWSRIASPKSLKPIEGAPFAWPRDIFILDIDHRPIVGGPRSGEEPLFAIALDGKNIGWLGQYPEPIETGLSENLIEGQNLEIYFLYAAVVLLTAGIAFLLSSHLLKPIRQLIAGTKQLANRDFSVRIPAMTTDELGQLASHFNSMAGALESYETMHTQLLTDISHELRTPLTVLRAEIEAFQDGIREVNQNSLASLHGEIIRISKLVEDLHLLCLMDSPKFKMNMQLVDPYTVLSAMAKRYDVLLDQQQIKLRTAIEEIKDIRMHGDRDRLGQVFANIFDNAWKYLRPNDVMEVSGSVSANGDARFLTVLFQDSGPGVSDETLSRLFDRLYREDPSRSRKTGGSGLGLSICRRIVEQHGGVIWAEESPIGGLTIGLRLALV